MKAAPLNLTRCGHVVIGVDTHKHVHVAAVMGLHRRHPCLPDDCDRRRRISTAPGLGDRVRADHRVRHRRNRVLWLRFDLASIHRNGHSVFEVNRPDRRMRRLVGKSDTLDAENAARAVLAGFATGEPETADGTVEMIRQLKVAPTVRSRFGLRAF